MMTKMMFHSSDCLAALEQRRFVSNEPLGIGSGYV